MTRYLLPTIRQPPGELLLLFLIFLFIPWPSNSASNLPAFSEHRRQSSAFHSQLLANTSDSHRHHHRHKHGQLDENRDHATGRQHGGHHLAGPTRHRTEIVALGNVTVLVGQRADLKCGASQLGNNTVVWLRHRDTNLLTAGLEVYTQDVRFLPFWEPGNIWGLRISSINLSDAGLYECQISTTPPVSDFAFVRVVEPVTRLDGVSHELFIDAGSTINLTCIVEDATDSAPKQVLWKHDSKVVNFEWARGGISLVTEKIHEGTTSSRLLIQKAVRTDSGIYSCAPKNAHMANVRVIVLEQGEKQAAMQSNSVSINKRGKSIPVQDYSRTLFILLSFLCGMQLE